MTRGHKVFWFRYLFCQMDSFHRNKVFEMNSIHASFLAEFALGLRPHFIFLVPCVTHTDFDFFSPSPPGFSLLGPP